MKYLLILTFAFVVGGVSAQSSGNTGDITQERNWQAAEEHMNNGRYARAFYLFEDYHIKNPEHAEAALNTGKCLAGTGKAEKLSKKEPCHYITYAREKGMDVPKQTMEDYGCE